MSFARSLMAAKLPYAQLQSKSPVRLLMSLMSMMSLSMTWTKETMRPFSIM